MGHPLDRLVKGGPPTNSFTTQGTTPNNYLYRGEQYDADLGLYYLRARYYNPYTGRFMSRDPEDGSKADPKTLHKYLYSSGDPVDAMDPTGRETMMETAIIYAKRIAPYVAWAYACGKAIKNMYDTINDALDNIYNQPGHKYVSEKQFTQQTPLVWARMRPSCTTRTEEKAMLSTEFKGLLQAAVVVSAILLVWELIDLPKSSHPLLFTLGALFNAMFLPAFVLNVRMREKWLLPGVASAMSAMYAIQEVFKLRGGSLWMLWIDAPFCVICALLALEEGICAWKRYRAGGAPLTKP